MRGCWALLLAACAAPEGGLGGLPVRVPEALRPSTRPEIAFRCSERDAEVVLDGVPQGTCADYDGEQRALALGRGRGGVHRVAVRKQGFTTWESWLEADGTRVQVDVTLTSVTGGSTP